MASRTPSPTFSEDSGYWEDLDRIIQKAPSPTLSEDFDHWQEVDLILNQHRQAVQNEEKYVNESVFPLNGSLYKIITGLSPARSYIPAVRFLCSVSETFDKTNHISLDVEEWFDFIIHLRRFCIDYFEIDGNSEEGTEVQLPNIRIITSPFLGNKSLKVNNGTRIFYLSESTVREFINMDKLLITPRINVLHGLDFAGFYNNFLNVTNNVLYQSNYKSCPYDTMLSLCNLLPVSTEMYCMRECLFFNKDKVLNNLDQKMFVVNE